MIVTIEIEAPQALIFFEWLNDDEGLREGAVRQLLQQHQPPSISQWTTLIAVFGALSAAFTMAVTKAGLLDTKKRAEDIRQLVATKTRIDKRNQ